MKNICTGLIILNAFLSCLQERKNGTIELKITSEELRISHLQEKVSEKCKLNCAQLKYKLVNNSQVDLILCNFNSYIEFDDPDAVNICDSLWGSAEKCYMFLTTRESRKGRVFRSMTV